MKQFGVDAVAQVEAVLTNELTQSINNHILTKMRENNLPFNKALKEAQQLGFAEANPNDDINGTDTAYKLAILSNLAFGINTKVTDIYTEGI